MDEPSATAASDPASSPGGMNERIQALFSRAVEEQVSEQRQLANALTEVRVRLTLLAEEVRGATGPDGDQVSRELGRLGEELREHSARQVATLDQLSAKLDSYAAFPSSLSALQDDLAGMHGRLQSLGELRDAVADVSARLGPLASLDQLAGAQADFGGRLETLDDIADSLVELHAGLANLATTEQLAQLRQRVDDGASQAVRDATAEPELAELPEQVRRLEGRLRGVDDQLRGLGDRLAELTESVSRLDGVPGQVGGLDERLAGVSGLAEQMGELRSAMAGIDLAEELADLRAQLHRLADRGEQPTRATPSGYDLEPLAAVLTSELRAASLASERRLEAHIDEAVLALADALLRRRPMAETSGDTAEAAATQAAQDHSEASDEGPGPVPVRLDGDGEPAMADAGSATSEQAEPGPPADPGRSAELNQPAQRERALQTEQPSPAEAQAPAASGPAVTPPPEPTGDMSPLDPRRRGLFRRRDG
ncbi:MAG: hypothetical protein NVSMB13_19070 [Mycobacteriales bacterium]